MQGYGKGVWKCHIAYLSMVPIIQVVTIISTVVSVDVVPIDPGVLYLYLQIILVDLTNRIVFQNWIKSPRYL